MEKYEDTLRCVLMTYMQLTGNDITDEKLKSVASITKEDVKNNQDFYHKYIETKV